MITNVHFFSHALRQFFFVRTFSTLCDDIVRSRVQCLCVTTPVSLPYIKITQQCTLHWWLFSGVYFSGVILYYPPPNFAVKPSLWLHLPKPGTWDPRWDPFHCFSIWYFWVPGHNLNIMLCYMTTTQPHLHIIYYICLHGWILWYPNMFYNNNVLLYTFVQFRWNPNSRLFLFSKMCLKL